MVASEATPEELVAKLRAGGFEVERTGFGHHGRIVPWPDDLERPVGVSIASGRWFFRRIVEGTRISLAHLDPRVLVQRLRAIAPAAFDPMPPRAPKAPKPKAAKIAAAKVTKITKAPKTAAARPDRRAAIRSSWARLVTARTPTPSTGEIEFSKPIDDEPRELDFS